MDKSKVEIIDIIDLIIGSTTPWIPRNRAERIYQSLRDAGVLNPAAPALLEALELADAALRGANMNMAVVERKVAAAIAQARGKGD